MKLIAEIDSAFVPAAGQIKSESPASSKKKGADGAAAGAASSKAPSVAPAKVRSMSGAVSPFKVAAAHYATKGRNYRCSAARTLPIIYSRVWCDTSRNATRFVHAFHDAAEPSYEPIIMALEPIRALPPRPIQRPLVIVILIPGEIRVTPSGFVGVFATR